jgi:hypothetical protein
MSKIINPVELSGLLITAEQLAIRADLLLLNPNVKKEFKHEVKRLQMAAQRYQTWIERKRVFNDEEMADIYELSSEMGETIDDRLTELFETMQP